MDDHHVRGKGYPARDGDGTEAGLSDLGAEEAACAAAEKKINNMVVPFKQTLESSGFKGRGKNSFSFLRCSAVLLMLMWSADVYCRRKCVEI